MKNIFYSLQLLLALATASIHGKIIETKQFQEIKQYVKPATLVILDIDDTLLLPVQTLGNDCWFQHRKLQHTNAGMSSSQALEKAISEWEAVRHLTGVKIVEEGTDKIIADIQKDKTLVIGLTTQGLALATRTVQQLNSLGIDLTSTAPSKEDVFFTNKHGVLYRQGILFTSGTPKGEALLRLFDIIDYHPKHIVFINDKATHLADVEQAVMARGIEFVGLRYSIGDERVAKFNPEIADLQWHWSSFDSILSDEDAEQALAVGKLLQDKLRDIVKQLPQNNSNP